VRVVKRVDDLVLLCGRDPRLITSISSDASSSARKTTAKARAIARSAPGVVAVLGACATSSSCGRQGRQVQRQPTVASKMKVASGRCAHRPDAGFKFPGYACLSKNTWPVSRLTATTCTLLRTAMLLPRSRLFKTVLLFKLLLRSPLRIGLPFNTSCKMRRSF
jgi:hypothetical protein